MTTTTVETYLPPSEFNWDEPLVTELSLEDLRHLYSPKQWYKKVKNEYPEVDADLEYQLACEEDEAKQLANRKLRMEACLKKSVEIKEDAATGDSAFGFARCHCLECGFCGPFEIAKYMRKVQEGLNKGPLRLLEGITEREKTSLIRKYKGERVESIPVNRDGKIVFDVVVQTDDPIGLAYTEVTVEQVTKWLQPVYGYNKSGKLFKESKPVIEKTEEVDSIFNPNLGVSTVVQFIDFSESNKVTGQRKTNEEWAQLVIDLSILETINLRPTDQYTLNLALQCRREARLKMIEKVGGVVFGTEYRKNIIKSDSLDWSKSASRVEKKRKELEKWLEALLQTE